MEKKKYGNLLDKFMDGDSKAYNGMLDKEKQKYIGKEEDRYGDLLKNAKPDMHCLDIMVNLENDRNRRIALEAEKEQQLNIDRQRRIEHEKQKHEEHIARNNAFVNEFLEKKKNEQEMRDRKVQEIKKREEEEGKLYSDIDKLMSIDFKLADAYIRARKAGSAI